MSLLDTLTSLSTSYVVSQSSASMTSDEIDELHTTLTTTATSLATTMSNGVVNVYLANDYIESLTPQEQVVLLEQLEQKRDDFVNTIEIEEPQKVLIKQMESKS